MGSDKCKVLTVVVCWQHWMAPVEQVWRASRGVATARRGVAAMARAMAREKDMLKEVVGLES